ncbi:MAG TPA: ABC transporter substrate-binding protein [Firmicutes bacterium]|nr:ABC transporter substrate-binding protein [Bacillota bacterium]
MKKCFMVFLAICLLMALLSLSACAPEGGDGKVETKTVGIVQIVEHPSLNTIRESMIDELAALGYADGEAITIDYQCAQNDQSNLKTICQKFANHNYDLIVAIATPSAQAAAGETSTIPIIFSACTDPVGSGLVDSLDKPGKNISGTSDAVSAEQIMELAVRITPGIKKIGALYNSSETNSVSVIDDLKAYAARSGLSVIEATVTNSSEVQQAVQSLVSKVDAIFSPIDNTVASAMPVVTEVTRKAQIPIYVGADSMVKEGGLATYGVNYVTLGRETAKMAAAVLGGKKAGELPVKTITDFEVYLNLETAEAIGVSFPDDVLEEAVEIFRK